VCATIGVTREEGHRARQSAEALGEGVIHLIWVSSGQIDATAALKEQRVTRYERVTHTKALRAGGVPRGVQELNLDRADLEGVTGLVSDEIGA
jgi:hypothetical protein